MKEFIQDVLIKGGVALDETDGKERSISSLLSLLESWLGFSGSDFDDSNDEDDSFVMMEDSGPFDVEFYKSVEKLLIEVWKPAEIPQHKFFGLGNDYDGNPDGETSTSLHKSILSVHVTKLLRFWMELNVAGREIGEATMSDKDGDYERRNTLSFNLLKNCSFDIKATSASDSDMKLKFFPLIQAAYQQIEQLPYLQSQIHIYSQSLTKGHGTNDFNRPGIGLANPQSRLVQLQMGQQVKAKLEQEFESYVDDLEYVIGEWYAFGSIDIRRQSRAQLGSVWSTFEARTSGVESGSLAGAGMRSENTSSSGIPMTLRFLHRILLGIAKDSSDQQQSSLFKSYEHLLFQHLIPLHRPDSMVLWRDQTCLLELYHEPLVKCIAILLKKKPELIGKVIEGLLASDVWNKRAGNTPKLVLLLHEVDTYTGCLPGSPCDMVGSELGDSLPSLLRILGSSMASENSRLAQRALPFVKNKAFVRLIERNLRLSLDILLPYLLRKEPSWNPTVRKMTYTVLKTLQDFDPELFAMVGNRILTNGENEEKAKHSNKSKKSRGKHPISQKSPMGGSSLLPTDYTVKSAMGAWTPPVRNGTNNFKNNGTNMAMPPPPNRSRGASGSANPPLAVTGVAPWAMKGPEGVNPPLAVTGVAPWAMKGPQGANRTMSGKKHLPIGKGVAPWAIKKSKLPPTNDNSLTEILENGLLEKSDAPNDSVSCIVLAYMEKIKPPKEKEGISAWSQTQMAETPTLLPTLKFYDLVFGHVLGEGSFGCVRYARLIDRATTRSHWSEYAVKVISTEKIKEMGYEAPIQRELAVLRVLSHPCIARMISSFRFREGVYVVLEYASGGDLHTLLKTNGSLDHESTRFVVGEVTSALASIHEIGLGYFDLKPENIVITESGHVKLTDFGGSRPVTQAAKKMISESARNVFNQLRDGGLKTPKKKAKAFDMDEDNESDDEGFLQEYDPDTDRRIEGTTIYLPPEVVSGSFPTLAADSWALGCVLYQCLTGRPPIIETDETLAKNRIVSFDVKDSENSDKDNLFGERHAANVEGSARDLITQLLNRLPGERPTMVQIADHPFFKDNGMDIFALWMQPALKLEVGDAAPPPADAGWARRQLSCIWAPQPQAYNISSDPETAPTHVKGRGESGPILEGKEASFFFSKSNIFPTIRTASQIVPMHPRKKVSEQ
mmetsp:Transcript_23610/g.65508  ORF Transcript_23610/g.65508 Transcript_23610/m.65508 type:complete len:1178 (+) Transcript_23610:69-3602(+)